MFGNSLKKNPIIDLTLFKSRNFTVGTIALGLGFMTYFGNVVILPLWLQTQMSYTPTWAGLAIAPIGLIPIVLSPIVGSLTAKIDARLLVSFGFIVFAYCCFWVAGFDTNVNFDDVALSRFVQGIGVPFFFIPCIAILFSGLPSEQIASAAGLSNFLRILASSVGTSISVTLWDHREAVHQSKLVESITSYGTSLSQALHQLQSTGLTESASYARIIRTVTVQSYMLATNDVFWISAILFLILFTLIWLARPPFTAGGRTPLAD